MLKDKLIAKHAELRFRLLARTAPVRTRLKTLWVKFSGKLNPLIFAFGKATPDIIVAHCEVNSRQGVGILLQRLFPDSGNIFSLRSKNLYDGSQDFGFAHACLSHSNELPEEVTQRVSKAPGQDKARRILSVPYYTDDVLTSIALKDLLDIPLCTYLMDDQNIFVQGIPDQHMRTLHATPSNTTGIAYSSRYQLAERRAEGRRESAAFDTKLPATGVSKCLTRSGCLRAY